MFDIVPGCMHRSQQLHAPKSPVPTNAASSVIALLNTSKLTDKPGRLHTLVKLSAMMLKHLRVYSLSLVPGNDKHPKNTCNT